MNAAEVTAPFLKGFHTRGVPPLAAIISRAEVPPRPEWFRASGVELDWAVPSPAMKISENRMRPGVRDVARAGCFRRGGGESGRAGRGPPPGYPRSRGREDARRTRVVRPGDRREDLGTGPEEPVAVGRRGDSARILQRFSSQSAG